MPPVSSLLTLIVALYAALLVVAAAGDVRALRIPNRIPLALVLLYPAFVLASPVPVDWLGGVGVGAAALAGGFALFALGAFGGGDAKLLAAVALWAGPAAVLDAVLTTALVGGAIALVMATRARFGLALAFDACGARALRDAVLGPGVPYGVAIAAGGLVPLAPLVAA